MLARRILLAPKARQMRARRGKAACTRLWLFDLDNTLHDTSHAIFPVIDRNMTAYVAQLLGMDPVEARVLPKRYYHDHGTTLAGLMTHHGVDPHHFLDAAHAIDYSPIVADAELANAIDDYKVAHRRRFITFEELFDVMASLGYHR